MILFNYQSQAASIVMPMIQWWVGFQLRHWSYDREAL